MPTKHPRILVTNDRALTDALATVAPFFEGRKQASIVHDLAIKGAETIARDRQVEDAAIERLIAWSTGEDIDRQALLAARDDAWRE